ncbi:unnamed protein product [Closterium sp. NIES-54]
MTTLQVLVHVAAQRNYELHSLDFSTAFLQGSLHEEIWLHRPPGFTGRFLRVPTLGFAPSSADPSLFLRTDTTLPPFYVLVYVDDLVFSTANTEALALVKAELQERHTCTDLGELRSCLGLQITQDRARRTITLTQSHMVHQVLQRFAFQFSSRQPTPLSTSHSLSAPPSDKSVEPSGRGHGGRRLGGRVRRALLRGRTGDLLHHGDPNRGSLRRGSSSRGGPRRGAELGGAELGGAESEGAEPGGAELEGAESEGAKPRGTTSSRGHAGSAAGGTGAGGDGATSFGGTGAKAGDPGAGGAGAVDPGAGGASVGGAASGGTGARGTVQRRPIFVPPPPSSLPPIDSVLRQVLSLPSSSGLTPSFFSPPPCQSQPQLQPDSPLPAPSPYAEQTGSFTERRELESRPASPVCSAHAGRRAPRLCPPPVVGTHVIALRPSSIPQRFPLPSPPASSLANSPDPESDLVRAASPTVPCLLTTVVTDPSFESTTAFAQVAELLDFAAACRLYYAASLIAESTSDYPPSVGGECALGTDVLEDRQETAMDAEMASRKSTGTYVDAVPPPGANIVDAMWFLRVKRPPGSLPVFKARYVARGFSPRQGFDFFHTFSLPGFTGSFPAVSQWSLRWPVYGLRQAPRKLHDTLSMTLAAFGFAPSTADTLQFLRTDTLLPPFYILLYVDELVFATADTEALTLVKSELQKRHTCTDMGDLRNYLGLQITRDRARRTITLTQSHMVHQVLQRSGFRYSSPQSTPLSTSHFLSAPPLDEVLRYLCSTSGMGLVLGGRDPVVLTEHAEASWVGNLATQRSSQGYTFSLGSGSVSWRSTCSSSVLSSSFEAEIYTGAMAAQELRRLTYLLADLGERPRSSPVLYVDNKAMIALCEEHRVEHRMKHIALRYFLHRELQQRSQLRLAYVATRANTADIFTKALQSPAREQPAPGLLPARVHSTCSLPVHAATRCCCCHFCSFYLLHALLLLLLLSAAATTACSAATATAACSAATATAACSATAASAACSAAAATNALPAREHHCAPARSRCPPAACALLLSPARPLLLHTLLLLPASAAASAATSGPAAAPELLPLPALPACTQPARCCCCCCCCAPSPTCWSCCYLLQLLLLVATATCCNCRSCCCSLLLLLPTATAAATPFAAATATARMANFSVLTFDVEGRAISFDVWLNDLQLYLQRISLFVHTEGTLPAPATTAVEDHSKWLMRDATARLTVRNHLPVAERAHFSQQKTAKALYDAVVARYSSPATAALGHLMLSYLHPELADFHCL